MAPEREYLIRSLFDEYIEMYASRDDRLTARFSDDFSGYTGGGDFLVKDRDEWKKITRLDFAQVTERIRIEMLDLSMQDLADTVVVATALFHIHLPIADHILSREKVRLVLIFRLENENWNIVHSGISVPYWGVQEGEVYPLKDLHERNRELEAKVTERTAELEQMLGRVKRLEGLLPICMSCKKIRTENNDWHHLEQYIGEHSDAVFSHGLCPECLDKEMKKLD
jgi:SnoaL-like protein